MCGGHIVRDQRDLETQRLGRSVGMHVATGEVHVAQLVGGERQRGLAGVQFAIGAALVQEPALQTEGLLEEGQGGRDIGDVGDGVAEFHESLTGWAGCTSP